MIDKSRRIALLYRARLQDVSGIRFPPPLPRDVRYNFSYMPIEVDEEVFGMSRDALYERLREYNVFARRYFYPLICDFACYKGLVIKDPLSVARRVASRILTLPIYPDLALEDVDSICDIIIALGGGRRQVIAQRRKWRDAVL